LEAGKPLIFNGGIVERNGDILMRGSASITDKPLKFGPAEIQQGARISMEMLPVNQPADSYTAEYKRTWPL
jgi:hypothetical protein